MCCLFYCVKFGCQAQRQNLGHPCKAWKINHFTHNPIVDDFVCPLVKVDEHTQLVVKPVRRRPEENPYLQIRAVNGIPLIARAVDLIVYRHDVLAENQEYSTNADWELISIHAVPKGVETLPMGPTTMMRNQLKLPGGTEAVYSTEEWAESVRFWQEYVALEPENESV